MNNDMIKNGRIRSASICAPGFSCEEHISGIVPASDVKESIEKKEQERDGRNEIPLNSATPTRKRRPATRSQSARVFSGNKNISRRSPAKVAVQYDHHHEPNIKSAHSRSEPKLSDNASPGIRRRTSRRGQSMHHVSCKKGNAFLDIPDVGCQSQPEKIVKNDDDSYRLRSFSLTSKGVINRGDSFRRRSRLNLLDPAEADHEVKSPSRASVITSYNVGLLGSHGVGKTALISQFMTSECINAYDRQKDVRGRQSVFVMLNGEESELKFVSIPNFKVELEKQLSDAYVIMYSVIDKASFRNAEEYLINLHDRGILRSRSVILVGNKMDLVRSRVVSLQDGKCMACTYRAKFIEISVAINHNIDDLLVGILNQIRLKAKNSENRDGSGDSSIGSESHWYRSRIMIRTSMKARQMLTWLFGRENSKFKNCENLHVL